jgi:recombinational DNA repair protein RecR
VGRGDLRIRGLIERVKAKVVTEMIATLNFTENRKLQTVFYVRPPSRPKL